MLERPQQHFKNDEQRLNSPREVLVDKNHVAEFAACALLYSVWNVAVAIRIRTVLRTPTLVAYFAVLGGWIRSKGSDDVAVHRMVRVYQG